MKGRAINLTLKLAALGLCTSVATAWLAALFSISPTRTDYEGYDAPANNRDWAGSIQVGIQRRIGFQRRYFGYSWGTGPRRSSARAEYAQSTGARSVYWGVPKQGHISVSGAFEPSPASIDEAMTVEIVRELLLSFKGRDFSATQLPYNARWGRFQQWATSRDWDSLEQSTQGLEDAAGWPFPALWCAYDAPMSWEPAPRALTPVFGYSIDAGSAPSVVATVKALPLHPVWGGLALNTLIWGSVWFAGVSGVGAAKRGWRRRRQRCVGCGYDLRGAASVQCPECGRER